MRAAIFLVYFLFLMGFDTFGQGLVFPYPQEPDAPLSSQYAVFVNEIPVSVYSIGDKDVSYAHFSFTGKITIRIHFTEAVNAYDLSPHSYGIESEKSGHDITFELDRPRKLLIKEVNNIEEQLCIFADPLEDSPPQIGDANVVNIMDLGVDNTGATDNYAIIQAAVKSLPMGGILYFPPGRYTSGGDLQMKNTRSIYLSGGATLQASDQKELRILFTGASNAKLFGRGSIDGRGDLFRPGYGGEGGNTLIYNNGTSDNCRIDGIILKNAVTWTAIVMYTTNWTVYNMKVVNGKKFSNHDSWDPHNAIKMMMDDLFLYGSDDAIAYSILKDNQEMNTTIRNSVFYNSYSGATVRIGPWVGNNTSNITVENNDHLGCGDNEYSLAFFLGGSVSNLKYLNNRVEDAPHGLILMRTNWEDHYAGTQSGSADGIIFDRLYVEKVSPGWEGHLSNFEGNYPSNFVKNITFKDFYQKGVLQTSKTTADLLFTGSYVSNVTFGTSKTPVVEISATELFAYREGSKTGKFTVSRSGGSTDEAMIVNYLIHGTAVNGTDYFTLADSVSIPAGSSSVDILVEADPLESADFYKTVFISLSSKPNYILGPDYHAVVTILNGSPTQVDNEPPTIPENLTSSSVTGKGLILSWEASRDNIGVASYEIFKDGKHLGSTSDTSYSVTGLSAASTYEFTVKAWDYSGNASGLSEAIQVSTLETAITLSYLNSLSVYPNPIVDHTLFVDLDNQGKVEDATVQIHNVNGALEFQANIQFSGRGTIELPGHLITGMYIMSIKTDEISLSNKIVLE